MSKTYTFHNDPGHGWLAVKRQELINLGIIDKITRFSYQSPTGKTVYLEEDCDAGLFVEAYMKRFGTKPAYKDSYKESSPIRNLPSFKTSPTDTFKTSI